MKTSFNIIKIGSFLITTMFTFSCQDVVTYDEQIQDEFASHGAPTIETIYAVKDQQTPISSGELEQIIVIKGANLSNVTEILFNDVAANLKEVYATAQAAYVPIPREIPTNVTNVLKYTTRLGSTSTDFTINLPQLAVEGLYNEFALPGDEAIIMGKFFDIYGFGTNNVSISLAGETLQVDNVSDSECKFTLPLLDLNNTYISIKSDKFSEIKLPYRNIDAIVWNFDTLKDIWGGTEWVTKGGPDKEKDPQPLYGSFLRLKQKFGAWSWTTVIEGNINISAEAATNPSDYYFKFEVNNKKETPFPNSGGAGYKIRLRNTDQTDYNYAWNPSEKITFNTYGNWKTVRISLDEVMGTNTLGEGVNSLRIILQPNSDWDIDHSFANFRIEKK